MIPLSALPTPVVRTRSPRSWPLRRNGAAQMPDHRCKQGHVVLEDEAAFKRGGEQY